MSIYVQYDTRIVFETTGKTGTKHVVINRNTIEVSVDFEEFCHCRPYSGKVDTWVFMITKNEYPHHCNVNPHITHCWQQSHWHRRWLCHVSTFFKTHDSEVIMISHKSELFSALFKIHALHMIASIWLQVWKLDGKLCRMKTLWSWWHHQWRHSVTLNIAVYINHLESEALAASSNRMNANIVIIVPC